MKLYLLLTFAAASFIVAQAKNCLSCTWPADSNCYSLNNVSTIPSLACAYATTANLYCRTSITLNDGIVSSLTRDCQAGVFDDDTSTDWMPQGDKCVTSFTPNSVDVETSTCYFSCNDTDNCNLATTQSLKLCTVSCGPKGVCDYTTGTCACSSGYSGDTCNQLNAPAPQTFRSCLHCDSETSSTDCTSSTNEQSCRNPSQQYCSVSKTTTYNTTSGEIMRENIARGCTDQFQAGDECFISSSRDQTFFSDEIDYTCVSTCDTDNCNSGTPDGKLDAQDPKTPLKCVVCDSKDGSVDCATNNTSITCSSGDSFCVSTVSYYISDKTDLSYDASPDYQLESIVRGCSKTSVITGCSNTVIGGSSLTKVSCQESCQTDGCNVGWPARPVCSQCSCTDCLVGNGCIFSPPSPTMCPMPYHQFCTIQDHNRAKDSSSTSLVFGGNTITLHSKEGFPRSIARSCSYKSIGGFCENSDFSSTVENCNKSCSTDGCNLGDAREALISSAMKLPQLSLVILLSSIFLVGQIADV